MEVEKRCQVEMQYAVKLEYEGLNINELSKVIEVIMKNKDKWQDLGGPTIKRDYEYFDDGWEEPLDTWNITIPIHECGGIDLDSYNSYLSSSVREDFNEAEELAAKINKALEIE